MRDDHDYYTVLGVPRGASDVEIRRAFRALAKALHPDSKQPGTRGIAEYDFTLLTEAYETLRDQSRRRAYDEQLNAARQLSSHGAAPRKPRRAFAAGLAIGVLFAASAIGGKLYLDRMNQRAGATKSQDSLRSRQSDQSATLLPRLDAQGQPAIAETPNTRISAVEPQQEGQAGSAPSRELPEIAGQPRQTASPATPPPAVSPVSANAGVPDTPLANLDFGSPQKPLDRAAEPRRFSPVQSSGANLHPSYGLSAFAQSVLALERTIDAGGDRVAAYRLVSLVSSSTNIDDLSQTAFLVNKPETRDLINNRIEALKQPQNTLVSADQRRPVSALPRPPVAKDSLSGAGVQPQEGAGSIEVAAGINANETVLRLVPGNGIVESFTDCTNCPELVIMPAGQATMGARPGNDGYHADEAPAHKIHIRKPLAVSKYKVSFGNWRACVEAGGCRPILSPLLAQGVHVPVTRVSWFDAKAYAEWLSQTTGRRYRLLSEAEWEYAARSGSVKPLQDRAVLETIRNAGALVFRPRQRFWAGAAPNAWGIHAMGANVLEWVEDCWHGSYDQAPSDASAWLSGASGDCAYRVVRGSGMLGGEFAGRRLSARAREFADTRAPTLGFRVAREIPIPTKTALGPR